MHSLCVAASALEKAIPAGKAEVATTQQLRRTSIPLPRLSRESSSAQHIAASALEKAIPAGKAEVATTQQLRRTSIPLPRLSRESSSAQHTISGIMTRFSIFYGRLS